MGNKLDKLKLVEKALTRDTLNKFYNISVGDYMVSLQGRYKSGMLKDINSTFDLVGDDWNVDSDNGYISCKLEDALYCSEIGKVRLEITLT